MVHIKLIPVQDRRSIREFGGGKNDSIIEPGGDGKAECVAACKFFSGAPGSSQWRKGGSALELNDTTDVGLAIATFNKAGTYGGVDHNSGIYMGHNPKTGELMIVDQWPNNGPKYDHPFIHSLDNHNASPSMSGDAYSVILVH